MTKQPHKTSQSIIYLMSLPKEKENKHMRLYTLQKGIFICGKIKEARLLLAEYARKYRTVKEMICKSLH